MNISNIIRDENVSTTVIFFCEGCEEWIYDAKVVLRECPHRNGTRIEHCPKCAAELGVIDGPVAVPYETPDCECWS